MEVEEVKRPGEIKYLRPVETLQRGGCSERKQSVPRSGIRKATENTPCYVFILVKGKPGSVSPGHQTSGLTDTYIRKVKSFPLMETFVLHPSSEVTLFSNVHCLVVPFGLTEAIVQKCDFQAPKQGLGSLPRANLLETALLQSWESSLEFELIFSQNQETRLLKAVQRASSASPTQSLLAPPLFCILSLAQLCSGRRARTRSGCPCAQGAYSSAILAFLPRAVQLSLLFFVPHFDVGNFIRFRLSFYMELLNILPHLPKSLHAAFLPLA